METFRDPLWGYQLHLPDNWIHRQMDDTQAFGRTADALNSDYDGPGAGHLLIRPELNPYNQPLESLWKEHIARTAGFIGAKQVGAADWAVGDAQGFEAEMVLPKRQSSRLWAGILQHGLVMLHFMVSHPLEERQSFEPQVTQAIASLTYAAPNDDWEFDDNGLPLPPDYTPADPTEIISDIQDPSEWAAFNGDGPNNALQAYYLREAPHAGWEFVDFVPFSNRKNLGFARFEAGRGEIRLVVGLMPSGQDPSTPSSPSSIVVRRLPNQA